MESNNFKFKLPIGDWSNCGHGINEMYIISSNKPLSVVKDAYFKACEKLGFTLDGHDKLTPCGEYGDVVFKKETIDALEDFGLVFSEEYDFTTGIEPYDFAQLVISFIMVYDSTIDLKIIDDDIPMFQHYGYDDKNRHIGHFGYGLFE